MNDKRSLLCAITFSFVILLHCSAMAQTEETAASATPAPTPNAELLRLEDEKKAAELKRDKLKAEKETFETQFPKPSATPLQGYTKISGVFIESEIITNFALSQAAQELVSRFSDKNLPINKIAVYNEKDLLLLQSYVATQKRIEALEKNYDRILHPPGDTKVDRSGFIPNPIDIATSTVGSFINLLSLFRTDTEISGQPFKIAENTLVNEVFRAMRDSEKYTQTALYYPAVFQPNLKQNFEILGKIDVLYKYKAEADAKINNFDETQKKIAKTNNKITFLKALKEKNLEKIEELKDSIAELENEGIRKNIKLIRYYQGKLIKLNKEIDEAEEGIKAANEALQQLISSVSEEEVLKLKALNLQFDQFISSLTTSGDPTGINLITALLRAENINTALAGGNSYWLQLQTVSAGGNNRIKTNLLKNVFTGGSLSHSGGVIITYNLFDSSRGCSVSSGEIPKYIQYVKSKNIMTVATPTLLPQATPRNSNTNSQQNAKDKDAALASQPILPICSSTETPVASKTNK